ncbi:MAG: thiamine biosynthesis protein ApbE [Bacteroides sp. 43_108]|nr:MAG: thiamine biosynthesis protein ApbE [Bacteroides sp. 43_108]
MAKQDISNEQENNGRKVNKKWWHIPFLLLLCAGTIYVIRTNNTTGNSTSGMHESAAIGEAWNDADIQKCSGSVFGTEYHITYQNGGDIHNELKEVMADVDNSLSPFNKESVITAINNGNNVEADSMFTEVFDMAKNVAEETQGAFDITVAPLVNAWGFGFKNKIDVSKEKIDSIRKYVGFEKVHMENGKVIKEDKNIMLDCSAIAKGYGVDAVGRYLEKKKIRNYMVEIGGEIRVKGCNPEGRLWKVGISKPIDDSLNVNGEIQEVLMVSDIAIATSGNYRNFYIKDNKKYAHTIDPRTGYPVQHSILSSTVVAPTCALADAYATSFMVVGLDEAKKILARHKELQAYFIYTDSKGKMATWCTKDLEDNLMKYSQKRN